MGDQVCMRESAVVVVYCCRSLATVDENRQGDVYQIEKEDLSGPWEVQNVLEPTSYENDRGEAVQGEYQAHTLQILVADVPGVLQQVSYP